MQSRLSLIKFISNTSAGLATMTRLEPHIKIIHVHHISLSFVTSITSGYFPLLLPRPCRVEAAPIGEGVPTLRRGGGGPAGPRGHKQDHCSGGCLRGPRCRVQPQPAPGTDQHDGPLLLLQAPPIGHRLLLGRSLRRRARGHASQGLPRGTELSVRGDHLRHPGGLQGPHARGTAGRQGRHVSGQRCGQTHRGTCVVR